MVDEEHQASCKLKNVIMIFDNLLGKFEFIKDSISDTLVKTVAKEGSQLINYFLQSHKFEAGDFIIPPKQLFILFGHRFGGGMKADYTWVVHFVLHLFLTAFAVAVAYYGTLLFGSGITQSMACAIGLTSSIIVNITTEFGDGWRFHWDPRHYFGYGDFLSGLIPAVLMFLVLKSI